MRQSSAVACITAKDALYTFAPDHIVCIILTAGNAQTSQPYLRTAHDFSRPYRRSRIMPVS